MVIYSGHECVYAPVKILYPICQKGKPATLKKMVKIGEEDLTVSSSLQFGSKAQLATCATIP